MNTNEELDEDAHNKQLEERTVYNLELISSFIEHLAEAGIAVPEKVFLDFFDA